MKFTKYSEAPDLDRNGAAGGVSYARKLSNIPPVWAARRTAPGGLFFACGGRPRCPSAATRKSTADRWAAVLQDLGPYFRLKNAFMPGYCASSSQALYLSLPPERRKLAHFAAPPLPTRPASLGSGGGPIHLILNTALRAAPSTMGPRGAGRQKKHSRPVGGCAAKLGTLLQVEESVHAGILGHVAQLLLDAEQLVVLGHAVGAAGGTVLIWPAFRATAMSAMVASSVSPERWDTMAV